MQHRSESASTPAVAHVPVPGPKEPNATTRSLALAALSLAGRSWRLAFVQTLVLATVAGFFLAWVTVGSPGAPVAAATPPPCDLGSGAIPEHIGSANPSMVVIGVRERGGGDASVEWKVTGAVAGPGLVMTCAHLLGSARRFRNPEFAIRGFLGRGGTIPAAPLAVHPGFQEFAKIQAELRSIEPGIDFPPGYDVALLGVQSKDWSRLGPPLRLPRADRVRLLRTGTPVFALAFPMERMPGGGIDWERPVPIPKFGRLGRSTGFLNEVCPPKDAQLLHHDVPMIGGMSGGILFHAVTGEPIGILSAASVVEVVEAKTGDPVRVQTGISENLAMRIDLVEELISGTARARQEERLHDLRLAAGRFRRRIPSAPEAPSPSSPPGTSSPAPGASAGEAGASPPSRRAPR